LRRRDTGRRDSRNAGKNTAIRRQKYCTNESYTQFAARKILQALVVAYNFVVHL
jgi:hypothetical protein